MMVTVTVTRQAVAMKWPKNNRNSLHHAVGPFLVLAQFFGILPVSGVWPTGNLAYVKFRWCSLVFFVAVGFLLFSIFDCILSTKVVIDYGLKIYTIGSLSFSVICIACFSVFLLLSRNWPKLIQQTAQCELIFMQKVYSSEISEQFSTRIRRWGVVLLCAALLEHSTYVSSAIYNNYWQIKECNLTVNFWQNYFQRERQQIFTVIKFNVWIIPLIEWTTIAMTFAWNFVDIFLVMVCRAMEARYKQLHWRIRKHANERMTNAFWHEVRCDLLNLTDLLKTYDKDLSNLLLLSCSHNMYFLCVQIYHSFQPKGNFMDELYFWFSLIYVLLRLLTMMFSAASIHEAVNDISHTRYEIPTKFWCLELKRLNEIISSDFVALSGKGFFFLTRRLIFSMAGTLLVYELVLINQMAGTVVQKSFCGSGMGSSKSIFN